MKELIPIQMTFLTFEDGIAETIEWYLENQDWLNNVKSGDYLEYYENMYSNR